MVFINDKTKVIISLEVSDPVRQPYGLLHGGVNAVMAETAASLGANQNVGPDEYAVGVNINTQHLLPVTSGLIIATATHCDLVIAFKPGR